MKYTSVSRFALHMFSMVTLPASCSTLKDPTNLTRVYQFPNETWVENLAVRSNGKVVVTIVGKPEVWQIDPYAKTEPEKAELLYRFQDVNSVLGIAEWQHDVFAVNVGNYSTTALRGTPGTYSVWNIDLSSEQRHVRKITDVSSATFLNGLASLPSNPTILLSADSFLGRIYTIDAKSGAISISSSDPLLQFNTSAPGKLGVNGVQFRPLEDDTLYFSNTFSSTMIGRMAIDAITGRQTGAAETILVSPNDLPGKKTFLPDDFSFSPDGESIWIATDPSNSILKASPITANGSAKAVLEVGGLNDRIIAGATAVKFDTVNRERLWIVTNGGMAAPSAGQVVGGSLFIVETEVR